MVNETEFQVEIKANNERDVLSIGNIDCPRMVIDLEISCSSLQDNIEISNLKVPVGQKKVRQLDGVITPESNSCFKYFIRPDNG